MNIALIDHLFADSSWHRLDQTSSIDFEQSNKSKTKINKGKGKRRHKKSSTVISTKNEKSQYRESDVINTNNHNVQGQVDQQDDDNDSDAINQTAIQMFSEVLKWIKLRDDCLERIDSFVTAILSVAEANTGNTCITQFMVLLQTLRKISCAIVFHFDAFEHKWKLNSRFDDAWKKVRLYVHKMINSLCFLNTKPFSEWIGLVFEQNPFLLDTDINGLPTTLFNRSMHPDLIDVITMDNCHSLSPVLVRLWHNISLKPRVLRRRQSIIMKDCSSDDSEAEYISLAESDVHKIVLRSWWKNWKRSRMLEAKRLEIMATRNYLNKRMIIERLQHNVWSCVRYRTMQQRSWQRKIFVILEAWKDYTRWCHRLHACRMRSLRLHCKYYMLGWRRVTREEFRVRQYWRHFKHRRLSWLFRALRNNMTLNKFILKHRLKTGAVLTFKDHYSRLFCFTRWKSRCSVILALDRLEFKVEFASLNAAFVKWRAAVSNTPVPVAEQIMDMGVAVSEAARNAALAAMSEARASRRDGYSRVRTVANVLLGRRTTQSYIAHVREIDERVHRVAAEAYQVGSSALRLSLEKASEVQEKVGKLVGERKLLEQLNLSTVMESWQQPMVEDPLVLLLKQKKLIAEQEQARRSRMLQALIYARSQAQSQRSEDAIQEEPCDGDEFIEPNDVDKM